MTRFLPSSLWQWLGAVLLLFITTEHSGVIAGVPLPPASKPSLLSEGLDAPPPHAVCCHEAGCALGSCHHLLTINEPFVHMIRSAFFVFGTFELISHVFETPYPPPKR